MDAKHVPKYECVKCGFNCIKNSDWSRHISTKKHCDANDVNDANDANDVNDVNDANDANDANDKKIKFTCKCGKSYKFRQGLFVHKKKCQEPFEQDKEIIKMLIKEKSELQNVIVEMMKTIQILTTPK